MNFDYTPKVEALRGRLLAFMAARVYPNEHRFREEVDANRAKGNPWIPTRLVEELKVEARAAGLWNLFLPQSARGAGLTKACGSAACAAAVAAARLSRTGRKVTVSLPGGDLAIEWRESDDHVLMTGPVEFEHRGRFDAALFAAAGA